VQKKGFGLVRARKRKTRLFLRRSMHPRVLHAQVVCTDVCLADVYEWAQVCVPTQLRDAFARTCTLGYTHTCVHLYMGTGISTHAYPRPWHTYAHRMCLHSHMPLHPGCPHRYSNLHTLTRINTTNTDQWPVSLLCLKETCDCIKNVGYISQIIKAGSGAVGLGTTLSGLPVLGCAQ
jgi:hypothetical protein